MERFEFEREIVQIECPDSDAESSEVMRRRYHGSAATATGNVSQRVFYYVWNIGTVLLILGNLIGLCVISAQLEDSRVAVSSMWNSSHHNLSVNSRLILIPMKSMNGTILKEAKALRVKRSSEEEILVRRKREPIAPLVVGLLIGGGATVGYLSGIGVGVAIEKKIQQDWKDYEYEKSLQELEGSGEEDYYDSMSEIGEEVKPQWVPYQEVDEQDMRNIWKVIDKAVPGIVFEEIGSGLEDNEDDYDGDYRARRHLKVGDEEARVSEIILTPINITLPPDNAEYIPVTDSNDRIIDLNDFDDDILIISDEDLRDESDNDIDLVLDLDHSEVGNRTKRDAVGEVVGNIVQGGARAMMSGGTIKDFAFNLLGPILQSLNRDNNVHAVKGFTRRFLPQTGFQSHDRGEIIKSYVQDGHLQDAVNVMAQHRKKMIFNGISDGESKTANGKGFLKLIPHLDYIITERLKTQTSVTTSLNQALFSEIKSHLKVDMEIAAEHIRKLERQANVLDEILTDLTEEEFNSRIGVFAMFSLTLVVCGIAVWGIKTSQDKQEKIRRELMRKIDMIIERVDLDYADRVKPKQTTRKVRAAIADENSTFLSVGDLTPPEGRRQYMLENL